MYGEQYRVSVEALENGFAVEVPDMEARAKKEAEAKKNHKGDGCCPSPYYGDCTKKFAAKSVREVLALVKNSLSAMPENEYSSAWDDAAATAKEG